PAEIGESLLARDDLGSKVTRARLRMLDLHLRKELTDLFGDTTDLDPLGTVQIVRLVLRGILQGGDVSLRQILDRDEASPLPPISLDRDRLTFNRPRHKVRQHRAQTSARTIRNPVAQNRHVDAVKAMV